MRAAEDTAPLDCYDLQGIRTNYHFLREHPQLAWSLEDGLMVGMGSSTV